MSYNVNAMNAYQQYGSSMAAGGGGTNMSGSGAKQGLGTKPSDAYKQYGETMTAGGGGQTMAGTGTSAYQQAQERAGRDRDEKPNSPAQLYQNSANAFANAGVNLNDQTWTPAGDPRLIYNENKFKTEKIVTDVKDYLRGTAIEDALIEAQGFEKPYTGLYVAEDRPLTEQELQQYKPLFDLMDDSIEVEELSRMDREDQDALLEAIGVGNLGRMPRDTAFLGGDFDVATTSQQFIRDAVRAKQIADELEKLSKQVDPNSPLYKEIQDELKKVQGEENETAPVVRPEMYEDMSTPVSPTDTITDDADGGAAPSDGKGLMSPDAGMLRPRARPVTSIMDAVTNADVLTNGKVDMNKVENVILNTIGNNIYSAGLLGAIKIEVGEGVKDESPYYSLIGARGTWDSTDKVLKTLPEDVQARLKADAKKGIRTGGEATSADRKMLGEAMFDEEYDGGKKYKGRGLIQLTHKRNYEEVGKRIGVDLVANPELVNSPKYAVPAAIAYMDINGFFELEPNQITKDKLQELINPKASSDIKNKRWRATTSYLNKNSSDTAELDETLRPRSRPDTIMASN